MTDSSENTTPVDSLYGFSIPARNARGRIVRIEGVLDQILAAHAYPPVVARLLAEALVVTALIGSLLKEDRGQVTIQAESNEGVIGLLVCDYREGELRGYSEFDEAKLAQAGPFPDLETLFGEARLLVTMESGIRSARYQGIVPLEGQSLSAAFEHYFAQSEQVPTLLRVGVTGETTPQVAGGILLQHVAEGEEGGPRLEARDEHPDWEHVSVMGSSITPEELTDVALPLDQIAWRLFHEEGEIRAIPETRIVRGCRCTVAHFDEVIARFPKEDRRDMADENGIIRVDCAFCSRQFAIQD